MALSCLPRRNPRRFLVRQLAKETRIRILSTSSSKEDDLESSSSADKNNLVRKPMIVSSYAALSKARLSALVVSTTGVGLISAGNVALQDPVLLGSCLAGTFLCSASAAALNQISEVNRDKRMKRTQQRPLVQGDLTIPQATTAAVLWGVAGTALLYHNCNPLTAGLGLANIVLYAGVYTPLKPVSVLNTWVGAGVGAIPPVMGWTAVMAHESIPMMDTLLHPTPLLLASLLYFWQMPHFFALSYMYKEDYERGGFRMLGNTWSGPETAQAIVRYAWYTSTIPVISTLLDVTSPMFAMEGLVWNAAAIYLAHDFARDQTKAKARRVFLASLVYLPSWLMLFVLHNKVWNVEDTEDETNDNMIQQGIQQARQQGREWCVHEKLQDKQQACPVVLKQEATTRVQEELEASHTKTGPSKV